MASPFMSISDIVTSNLCAGCGLCESIAGSDNVRVELDHAGFYRPRQLHHDALAWDTVSRVCPGLVVEQERQQSVSKLEKLWGPIIASMRGWANDNELRWTASSGGALSGLLVYLLESGNADFVLHIGEDSIDPYRTSLYASSTRQQVLRNAGSRYAPSAPLRNIRQILERTSGKLAFVGKPCDIVALRAYLKRFPEYRPRVGVLISFVCAGIPSTLATRDLVRELGVDEDSVQQVRYRGHGWPGMATAVDAEGKVHCMSYSESWGNILNKRLQFRCKICPDGVGGQADIVFGDAWYSNDGYPDFSDRPGESLIITRTEHGQTLVQEAIDAGYIATSEFDPRHLQHIQRYQISRRQAILPRLLALKLFGRPTPRYSGLHLLYCAWTGGPRSFVRQFIGMVRRIIAQT